MAIAERTEPERRPPVSRERVLRTAVDLADEGGIEAVSMRKLGQRLGVEAMALYRHVRDKDDLLDGLADIVLREIEPPEADPDWRADLRGQVLAARAVMVRHPWAPGLLIERGTAGPAALDRIEAVLATMFGAGFSVDLAHHALHVLSSRIFGFSQDLFDDSPRGREPGPMPAVDRYPNVGVMARAASHEGGLGYCDDDAEFAFGLDLILAGLERLRA